MVVYTLDELGHCFCGRLLVQITSITLVFALSLMILNVQRTCRLWQLWQCLGYSNLGTSEHVLLVSLPRSFPLLNTDVAEKKYECKTTSRFTLLAILHIFALSCRHFLI